MRRIGHIICIAACIVTLAGCHSREEMAYSWNPVENVEALWQFIDTRYCYVEEKGVDWNAIHDEYIEKAKLLKRGAQMPLFDLCAEMLNTLQDGHVNLISNFDVSHCTSWYDSFPTNFDSQLQQKYLKNYRTAGELYYSVIEKDNIGYIYYPSFNGSFGPGNIYWIFQTFHECDCKGLIIDVRNNGGGNINRAYMLSSPFFTENRVVGYWQHKTGPGHHEFSEMEELKSDTALIASKWDRPVVVLCNRRSYSATNTFINIMRYADNAKIVGGTSGGGGGMPMSYELPCGWMVRFSSVRMYDRDKKDIEQGIEPDVAVDMVSSDKDDIIEKAIEIIKNW